MSPWFWLGWVLILVVLAFLVVGTFWAIRRLRPATAEPDTPLMILKHRYALGEIDPSQFETMKRQLTER